MSSSAGKDSLSRHEERSPNEATPRPPVASTYILVVVRESREEQLAKGAQESTIVRPLLGGRRGLPRVYLADRVLILSQLIILEPRQMMVDFFVKRRTLFSGHSVNYSTNDQTHKDTTSLQLKTQC